MKKIYITIVLVSLLGVAGTSYADQVNVNIAYPLNGGSYKISPHYPFLTISFSVTCKGLDDRSVKSSDEWVEMDVDHIHNWTLRWISK